MSIGTQVKWVIEDSTGVYSSTMDFEPSDIDGVLDCVRGCLNDLWVTQLSVRKNVRDEQDDPVD